MEKHIFKTLMILFISLILIFASGVMMSIAQEKTQIAGKFTATYLKQETIEVGDTEGHIVYLEQTEGTNESTGEHTIMDGARVVNVSFSDLVKGNGPHQGYIKFAQNDDTYFAKWEGTVTTTLSAEGTPIITFEGTYFYIKGTGQFENIQGSGTYKGKFISETTYIAEWEGEYFIKE
jgi:hypothetical protein